MSTDESVLEEAQRIIHGPRAANYGHPRDNFQNTADLWNAYLGINKITPQDVSLMMVLVKLSRLRTTGYHRDSVVDIAGYAGTIERLQEPLPGLVLPDGPSYHYMLHTEDLAPRKWDQITDVPKDGSVTQLIDNEDYRWERRGNRWGWYSSDEVKPIWYHTLVADLKDRSDGPFTEVK